MAYVKVYGKEKLLERFKKLSIDARGAAWRKGLYDAAKFGKLGIERSAPRRASQPMKRKYGPLHQNIIIYERKHIPTTYMQGRIDNALALLIGTNKKAFYGWFRGKGFMHHTGQSHARKVTRGRRRVWVHEGGKWVPGHDWVTEFFDAYRGQMQEMVIAGIKEAMGKG